MRVLLLSVSAAIAMASVPPAVAGAGTAIPVVWESPTCDHDKLGQVSIHTGTRVSETTKDTMVPTVDYDRAFTRLAIAAQAQGGNAVVVRWHQATYFTRNGRRSRKPVYVQLRGAAIRTHGAVGQCDLALADPLEFEERAKGGEPVNVSSGDAYND